MFTKALIAAFTLATCAYGSEDECKSEYYASCGAVGECCAPMKCWNGGDPYHCQVSCWFDWECKRKELKEKFGDMYCEQVDIAGFCR